MSDVNLAPTRLAPTCAVPQSQVTSLISNLASKSYAQPVFTPGVLIPLFQSTTQLASISGTFAIASNGGLVASVSGTTASGVINLPAPINYQQPWRLGALIEYNGDAAQTATITLQNPNDTSWATLSVSVGPNGVSTGIGGGGAQPLLANLAAGQRFWFYICSDGNTATFGTIPTTRAGITNAPTFNGSVFEETYRVYSNTYANGSHTPVFTNLQQIAISTKSTTTRVMGIYYTPGLAGSPNAALQPPAIMATTIATDNTVIIRIPETYTGFGPTDAIITNHPNGSDERYGHLNTNSDSGVAFATLAGSGYIMAMMRQSNDLVQTVTGGSGGATNGATTIPVVALTSPILVGTALTWSGTGTPKTTLTSTAWTGATTLNVSGTWANTGNIASGDTTSYGAPNTYSPPLASNWGATGSLITYWTALLQYIRTTFQNTRNLYAIGQSMGGLNALAQVSLCPNLFKAVAGISAVTNLSDCYNNYSFAATINSAFPSWYVCIQAGTGNALTNTNFWKQIAAPGQALPTAYQTSSYSSVGAYSGSTAYSLNNIVYSNATALSQVTDHDPNLRPGLYVNLPIMLWQGTADTTISPTNNAPLFATNVNALGGNVTVVNVSGGIHLSAGCYNGSALLAFFQANQ